MAAAVTATTAIAAAVGGHPVQHTVFFKFPEIDAEGYAGLKSIVAEKFNALDGIWAQFYAYGEEIEGATGMADFLPVIEWPDKTNDFSHCLFVLARDAACLKGYLHSDEHKKDWFGGVGPYIKGIIVFDAELVQPIEQFNTATIQHSVLFKFPALVDQSAPELDDIVAKFNQLPGIVASFRPYGMRNTSKADTLAALEWPDKMDGYTHVLYVMCHDAAALKNYLHSDEHKVMWFPAVKPYIQGILVFDTVLENPAADVFANYTCGPTSRPEFKIRPEGYSMGVGTAVFVTNPNYPGCVMLGKRIGSDGSGTYALPGGHLEFAETPEQCGAREVFEEAGLSGLMTSMTHVGTVNAVDAGIGYHYVCSILLCETTDEPVNTEPNKNEGWEWVQWDAEDFPTPLFTTLRIVREGGYSPFVEGTPFFAL